MKGQLEQKLAGYNGGRIKRPRHYVDLLPMSRCANCHSHTWSLVDINGIKYCAKCRRPK